GVLPGIVLAYFLSKGKNDFSILFFSALFGVLVSYIIDWFTHKVKLFNNAAIGVSFTFLFSIGIILISKYGRNLDLDPECVLFGELTFIIFNLNTLGIPYALLNNLVFSFITFGFISIFYK
ncbi:metal ABC transporter permease, partial [Arthrospira platensis SPKY1]|nr:metal ABC transporter permease [Arthrospira platensis SPKY1]